MVIRVSISHTKGFPYIKRNPFDGGRDPSWTPGRPQASGASDGRRIARGGRERRDGSSEIAPGPRLTADGANPHSPPRPETGRQRQFIERNGAVAQLGERRVRNAKVRGSIPLGSTTT